MPNISTNEELFSRSSTTNIQRVSDIHWHQKHELYYLISGTTKYLVEDRPFFLQTGNLIFIPQGVLHSTDSETCLETKRLLLNFDDAIIPDSYRPLIEDLAQDNIIYIPKNDLPKIDALFQKIEYEYNSQNSYKQEMLDLHILELITLIMRVREKDKKPDLSPQNALVYQISKYIRKNYHRSISLGSLSEHFSISQSYLSRRFKNVLGIGVSDYITYIRILHAEQLLKTTNYPITRIAEECGYNDGNYFVTAFKKAKGVTPFQFRKHFLKKK